MAVACLFMLQAYSSSFGGWGFVWSVVAGGSPLACDCAAFRNTYDWTRWALCISCIQPCQTIIKIWTISTQLRHCNFTWYTTRAAVQTRFHVTVVRRENPKHTPSSLARPTIRVAPDAAIIQRATSGDSRAQRRLPSPHAPSSITISLQIFLPRPLLGPYCSFSPSRLTYRSIPHTPRGVLATRPSTHRHNVDGRQTPLNAGLQGARLPTWRLSGIFSQCYSACKPTRLLASLLLRYPTMS